MLALAIITAVASVLAAVFTAIGLVSSQYTAQKHSFHALPGQRVNKFSCPLCMLEACKRLVASARRTRT